MRKLIIVTGLIFSFNVSAQNVESYINNYNFELTNWQDISWFTQTNTGNPIIVNQTETYFSKNNITAYSGLHFAFIGGYQNAGGLYEGQLVQEFHIHQAGIGHIDLFMKAINMSSDPGSYIKIKIDGITVHQINPYYMVDPNTDYEKISIELGYLSEGNHTIEVIGYENPLGGTSPMQFAFDDVLLITTPTSSIEGNNNTFNIIAQNHTLLIQSSQEIDNDTFIQIVDLSGKQLFAITATFSHQFSIPTDEFNSGIYVVNVVNQSHSLSKKIYINK